MDERDAAALLGGWNNVLILTHKRPDGDTVGCAVGLCALLRQLGKTAWVLKNPDVTELFTPYLEGYVAPADFVWDKVVSVDVATLNLLCPNARAIADRCGIDLAIDHHPSNEGFARKNYVEADKAACGEIIYKLVAPLGGTLTPEVATPLYLAVSTDTGCFAYSNVTANTHAVAAALLGADIPYKGMNKRHFRTKTMARLRLESALLASMELFEDGQAAVVSLSLDDMDSAHATEVDAEDIAAFAGQIEGVKASATVREMAGGECKISLRSDPAWLDSCAACALLGGGGHKAASGATVQGTLEDARRAIREAMEQVRHGA